MQHYICTGGCGGQSENEGVCEARYCKKEGEPLTSCTCDDGLHNLQDGTAEDYEDDVEVEAEEAI